MTRKCWAAPAEDGLADSLHDCQTRVTVEMVEIWPSHHIKGTWAAQVIAASEVRHAPEHAEDPLFCDQNIATVDYCFIF